jgi:hypothetical protein
VLTHQQQQQLFSHTFSQLLEHLLRAHQVHLFDVDALLRAALPFHEAPLFARLVEACRIDAASKWHFAVELQKQQSVAARTRGAALLPLSRLTLAKRCLVDDALLQFVCANAFLDAAPSLWISLYAVTVLDLLTDTVRVDDALMHRLLPHALRSLRSQDRVEHRHAGCLIVAQLCTRASMRSTEALQAVLDALSRAAAHVDCMRSALLALAHVCRAQHSPALPTAAVDRLLYEVPQCELTLAELHREAIDVSALASLLLEAVASRCASGDARALSFAAKLLASSHTMAPTPGTESSEPRAALLLLPAVVDRFTSTLVPSLTRLQSMASADDEHARETWRDAIAVLRALDTRHAAVLDGTIAKLLAANKAGAAAGDALLSVVCAMLPGVRHTAMPNARCTLGAALAHPVAGIRAAALRRGGELLVGVAADELLAPVAADSNLLFVRNAILHALQDDSVDVVRAALDAIAGCGSAFSCNAALLAFLQPLLRSDADPRGLQREALAALAAATVDADDAWFAAAMPLVFEQLFETTSTAGSSRAARRICASGALTHPLTAGLDKLRATGTDDAKPTDVAAMAAANRQLVDALARNVAANPEQLVPLCCVKLDECSVRGRWLAVLVLDVAAAHTAVPGSLLKVLVPLALTHLHIVWAALDDAQRAAVVDAPQRFAELSDRTDIASLCATAEPSKPSPSWALVLLGVLHRCVVAMLRIGGSDALTAYHKTDYGQMDDKDDDDDDESESYAMRVALRTVMRDALSGRGLSLALRPHLQAILAAAGHALTVPLLSSFWCTRPEQACSSALHIAAALITARGLPDDSWSTLLVTLLPPLTSKSEPLRVGALACLQATAQHGDRPGKFVQGCVRLLLDIQHEVQLDGKVAREALAELANLIPADALEAGHVGLARAALAMPSFVAMPTMRAVQAYVSPGKAAVVVPMLLKLVAPDSPTLLTTTRCKLVGVLLRTLTAETAAVFAQHGRAEQFLRHALLLPLRGTRRAIERMRAHVADQLTPTLCRALPEPIVAAAFAILCRARREHAAIDVTTRAITTALRVMPVSFAALEQALRISDAAAGGAPTPGRKRTRSTEDASQGGARDSPAPPLTLLERLADVLEAVHLRVTTAASDASDVRLVGALCGTLRDLVALTPDAARSYAQQLALTILLELVNRIEASAASADSALDSLRKQLDINVLVETLRGSSDSSQTQRHVLLLLAELARLFPAAVLTQVMPVFQLVGATAMRRDDAHSFQTIERTIRSLVPAVVSHARNPDAEISQLLDLFVNAAVHVPAHRRPLLFTVLASTLSAQYLPSLVERLIVFAARVRNEQSEAATADDDDNDGDNNNDGDNANNTTNNNDADMEVPKTDVEGGPTSAQTKSFDAPALAAELLRSHPIDRVLGVLQALVKSLAKCQNALGSSDPGADVDGPQCETAWRVLTPSARATFAILMPELLLATLTSSELLSGLVTARSAKGLTVLQAGLGDLFVLLLRFDIESGAALAKVRRAQRQWWSARRQMTAKLLAQIGATLDVSTLAATIESLLKDGDARVRRRAAAILAETVASTKLRHSDGDDEHASDVSVIVALVPALLRRLNDADDAEQDLNRQHMLVALDAIAASCAALRPQPFVDLIPLVLGSLADASMPVAAAGFVLFATLIERLGVRITPALPELLPSLLRDAHAALHTRGAAAAAGGDSEADEAGSALLRLSLLTTLHAAVTTLGSLLHGSLPQLMALLVSTAARRDARSAAKADATLAALAERVELRLLIAPMYTTFKSVVASDDHAPVLPLLAFGERMLERSSHADVLLQRMLMFKCCLACFEYRTRYAASAAVDVADEVESRLQAMFVALVLKLSETHFKPIFLKLQDWCTTSSTSVERAQFFYALLGRIAAALRSIAVPYFEYVIPDIVQRLKPAEVAAAQRDADAPAGKRRRQSGDAQTAKLVVAVIDALQLCFGHDRDQFIDQKRFDLLLPVIATQMEPRDDQSHADYTELVSRHVQPCLLSLAVALNDEKYWRSIHNAVLAFAHHRSSRVRIMSLKIIDALYETIGENMLPLLPETIPFLSELMEDSNSDVERFAHAVVERLEQVLGANQVRDLL